MKNFSRILIGLDFSEMDETLLKFTHFWIKTCPPEKIYSVHVSPHLELPDYILDKGSNELKPLPLDEKLTLHLQERVEAYLDKEETDIAYEVVEGSVTRQLMHWTEVKAVNLAILGRKDTQRGSGLSVRRYLRHSPASILLVPEKTEPALKSLLVATDFSSHATAVLQEAIELAQSVTPAADIHLLHVFEVPAQISYRVARTYDQLAKMVKKNTKEYMNKYLGRIDTHGVKIHPVLVQNVEYNTAWYISNSAHQLGVGLILMGVKGHSGLEAFLLGSVAERSVNYVKDIPLLLVRKDNFPEEN